jgi:phosphoribosylformimino-5-aminoimidazole carboxamide ribotide isomerase
VQLYPAIDVQGGSVARADRAADPVAAAGVLAAAGVAWVHLVDLDRARGSGRDDRTVRDAIAALAGVRVQLGGGLVDPDDVREALGWGVARVVVGAGAVSRLRDLVALVGADRLAVSIDHPVSPSGAHPLSPSPFGRGGTKDDRKSPLSGTERGTGGEDRTRGTELENLVPRVVDAGITTIIYRDHDRDGTLGGADLEGAARLLGRGADVVLAGGVATLDELRAARNAGLAGVIVGRALLAGRFTLAEALACCG